MSSDNKEERVIVIYSPNGSSIIFFFCWELAVAPEADERWAMHHNYSTRDKCTLQINGSLFSLFHPFVLNIVLCYVMLCVTITGYQFIYRMFKP